MNKMKIFIFFALINILPAQEESYPPPSTLVTIPSAGTLVRGSYGLQMRIQKGGGMITSLSVGITDRFQFGLSFGAANLIGDDSLEWYPRPEANFKYLLIDETEKIPGLSLGIDTQGFGKYYAGDSLNRYENKAWGLYMAASKNWATPLGNLGLHAGTSYNFLEIDDGDKDLNTFFGVDIDFNPELSVMVEYNAALNENEMTAKSMSISRGGYLNAGLRWTFVERLHIEMDFNNLLFDNDKVDYFNRELKITYIEYF